MNNLCSEVGDLFWHVLVPLQVIILSIYPISSFDSFYDISFTIGKDVLLESLLLYLSIFDFLLDRLSSVIFLSIPLFVLLLLKVALAFVDVSQLVFHSSVHVQHPVFNTGEPVGHSCPPVKYRSEEFSLVRHIHPLVFKEILKHVMSSPRNNISKDQIVI